MKRTLAVCMSLLLLAGLCLPAVHMHTHAQGEVCIACVLDGKTGAIALGSAPPAEAARDTRAFEAPSGYILGFCGAFALRNIRLNN